MGIGLYGRFSRAEEKLYDRHDNQIPQSIRSTPRWRAVGGGPLTFTRTALSVLIALLVLLSGFLIVPTVRAKQVTVTIEMKNFQFNPNEVRLDPGDAVTIRVFNNETTAGVPHTFDIDLLNVHIGSRASPLLPGQQGAANFTANQNGTFWYHCDIPGHATQSADGSWSGMAGRIIIGQGGASPLDPIPFIIGGVVVLAAGALVALYFTRRKK